MTELLFGKGAPSPKRIYIWNLITSLLYSAQSALLLLVVTRAGGLPAAGVFSIIYTVPQTLTPIGSFSMRNYQVSDTRNEYSFPTYFTSRILTCCALMIAVAVYALAEGMQEETLAGVLLFGFYRAAEALEDVFCGAVEKERRLDAAAMAQALRILASSILFCVVYAVSRDLVLSVSVLLCSALLLMLWMDRALLSRFPAIRGSWDMKRVFPLLKAVFPVFLGGILYNYLVSAPKLSIFRVMDKESQALFNILFMPIFIINILSQFVFRPMVAQMGAWWNEGDLKSFRKSVRRQAAVIAGLTAAVAAAGYFPGCRLLGLVYGVDLSGHEWNFAMLLAFGGFAALSTFLGVVLTIMRRQTFVTAGYIAGMIPCLLLIDRIIRRFGLPGAGYAYGMTMAVVLAVFLAAYLIYIRRGQGGKDHV